MKLVAFESYPEINGFVEKLVIFFQDSPVLHTPINRVKRLRKLKMMKRDSFLVG